MPSNNSPQWNAAQFFGTLNFFGEIPFLGSFRWLQEWLGQRSPYSGKDLSVMKQQMIVVGEIPTAEFEKLQQRYSAVDIERRSEAEILAAHDDKSANHQDLRYQMMCEDKWVIAEVNDLSALVKQLAQLQVELADAVCRPVFDFTKESADFAAWGSLDDVVMGGVSKSQLVPVPSEAEDGAKGEAESDRGSRYQALFTGVVSTENSGGFSSVRTQNFEPPFNLSGYEGIRLRIKGDGQRYKFIARNSAGWDSPAYIYSFDTPPQQWCWVDVPFAQMVPTFRARSVPDATPFDPAKIYSFQLMLSKFEYDRQLNPNFSPGPFSLAIERISAYRDRTDTTVLIIEAQNEAAKTQQQTALSEALSEAQLDYRLIDL